MSSVRDEQRHVVAFYKSAVMPGNVWGPAKEGCQIALAAELQRTLDNASRSPLARDTAHWLRAKTDPVSREVETLWSPESAWGDSILRR